MRKGAFRPGRLPEAGVTILKIVGDLPANLERARYLVRHDCCGDESTISQVQLRYRVRNGTKLCWSCARKDPKVLAKRAATMRARRARKGPKTLSKRAATMKAKHARKVQRENAKRRRPRNPRDTEIIEVMYWKRPGGAK